MPLRHRPSGQSRDCQTQEQPLPEFPAFLRDFGFIALWDQYGAPNDCKRTAPGHYDCT